MTDKRSEPQAQGDKKATFAIEYKLLDLPSSARWNRTDGKYRVPWDGWVTMNQLRCLCCAESTELLRDITYPCANRILGRVAYSICDKCDADDALVKYAQQWLHQTAFECWTNS